MQEGPFFKLVFCTMGDYGFSPAHGHQKMCFLFYLLTLTMTLVIGLLTSVLGGSWLLQIFTQRFEVCDALVSIGAPQQEGSWLYFGSMHGLFPQCWFVSKRRDQGVLAEWRFVSA